MKNLPLVANKQGICSRNININAIWVWAENTVNSGVLLHLHHQTLQFFGEPPVPTDIWFFDAYLTYWEFICWVSTCWFHELNERWRLNVDVGNDAKTQVDPSFVFTQLRHLDKKGDRSKQQQIGLIGGIIKLISNLNLPSQKNDIALETQLQDSGLILVFFWSKLCL